MAIFKKLLAKSIVLVRKTVEDEFWKNKYNLILTALGVAGVVFLWATLLSRVPKSGQLTVTHYNVLEGADVFGPWYYLLLPAVFASAIFVLNLIFAITLYKRKKLASFTLQISTLVSYAIFGIGIYLLLAFSGI